jgi:hypothetical protein
MVELEVSIGFLLAMERGDFYRVDRLLSENVRYCGPVPHPLDKAALLCLLRAIRAGIPNWKANFHDVQAHSPFASMTLEISGTHLRPLPPLLPGMYTHPPTGKPFRLPPERIEFTISAAKQITHIHIDPVPGGGHLGMLAQLDILVPVSN